MCSQGRREVWEALQAAFGNDGQQDNDMIRTILEAANITLPTRNRAENCYVCYDGKSFARHRRRRLQFCANFFLYIELGNRYSIPLYVIAEPVNLIEEQQTTTTTTTTCKSFGLQQQPKGSSSNDFWPANNSATATNNVPATNNATDSEKVNDSDTVPIKVRLSTAQDVQVHLNPNEELVSTLRERVFAHPEVQFTPETHTIRFIYMGRVLADNDILICEGSSTAKAKSPRSVLVKSESMIQGLVSKK